MMNLDLAAMYNTHGVGDALQEEQSKIASLELFAKTAAAEGIDLSQYTDEAKNALFTEFVQKLAADGNAPPWLNKGKDDDKGEKKDEKKDDDGDKKKDDDKKDEDEKKEAAARAEVAQMNDWQQKCAEADYLGRQMAHAFHAERQEIEKEAGRLGNAAHAVGKHLEDVGQKAVKTVGRTHGEEKAMNPRTAKAIGAAAYGGSAAAHGAAAGGVAYGAKKLHDKKKTKEASALDELAAQKALEIAKEAGYDGDQAIDLLNAVITLGGPSMENTKVAQVAGDYDAAVQVRGLEFLEAAGYPVDWNEVFGQGQ